MNEEVKKRGAKTPNTIALKKIDDIKVNDSIVLNKEEWIIVTPPGAHILRRHLNREFKVETLLNNTGWRITALS